MRIVVNEANNTVDLLGVPMKAQPQRSYGEKTANGERARNGKSFTHGTDKGAFVRKLGDKDHIVNASVLLLEPVNG